MGNRRRIGWTLGLAAALTAGSAGQAATIEHVDFDTLGNGEIVNNQYQGRGLTIRAKNNGGGPDLAVAFDTSLSNTRDPDLEQSFVGGNIAPALNVGNALIIQENSDGIEDGFADHPDDEANHSPAGWIEFGFDRAIDSFGFDLYDLEEADDRGNNGGFVAEFYDGGALLGSFTSGEFITPGSGVYDPTLAYGNHSANRFEPFGTERFEGASFDRVRLNLSGSGAVDNVRFTAVPTPTAAAGGLMLLGLMGLRRRRRQEA